MSKNEPNPVHTCFSRWLISTTLWFELSSYLEMKWFRKTYYLCLLFYPAFWLTRTLSFKSKWWNWLKRNAQLLATENQRKRNGKPHLITFRESSENHMICHLSSRHIKYVNELVFCYSRWLRNVITLKPNPTTFWDVHYQIALVAKQVGQLRERSCLL